MVQGINSYPTSSYYSFDEPSNEVTLAPGGSITLNDITIENSSTQEVRVSTSHGTENGEDRLDVLVSSDRSSCRYAIYPDDDIDTLFIINSRDENEGEGHVEIVDQEELESL